QRHATELRQVAGAGDDEIVRARIEEGRAGPETRHQGRQPPHGTGGREPRRTGAAPAPGRAPRGAEHPGGPREQAAVRVLDPGALRDRARGRPPVDRKSTRLNSSHVAITYGG